MTQRFILHPGDCLKILDTLDENSIDAVVTDAPYHLTTGKNGGTGVASLNVNSPAGRSRISTGFMGKVWDGGDIAFRPETWAKALRVLKPGGHLIAFGGTRTYHRLGCAIEDAGFEIREMHAWLFGSGFPKSADISKHIDSAERKKWMDVCKAVDNVSIDTILRSWKEHSKTVSNAALSFQKSETATGMNTQKRDSAREHVLLRASLESANASALIAGLRSSAVPLTHAANYYSAQFHAEKDTMAFSAPVTTAGRSFENQEAMLVMPGSSALQSAWGWQNGSTVDKLAAVEALKIWLGNKPSSRKGDINALCAALTDDLKRIILSQSETFQNFDTKSQMECASAISVTITESTAENLISFMVDTLRNKAIDKAAGAAREIVGPAPYSRGRASQSYSETRRVSYDYDPQPVTAPATDAARQWTGWGTATKPAMEPVCLARKPLSESTVAANVLRWGTGALNIDATRIETDTPRPARSNEKSASGLSGLGGAVTYGKYAVRGSVAVGETTQGRWPANICHDGSDEVLALFPQSKGQIAKASTSDTQRAGQNTYGAMKRGSNGQEPRNDSGSAARFFYQAKASAKDRADSKHPTVKPVALMRQFVRLVTPPGGTVLDLFAGSGTTGQAAIEEGFNAVLIEQEDEYCADIIRRMNAVLVEHDADWPF